MTRIPSAAPSSSPSSSSSSTATSNHPLPHQHLTIRLLLVSLVWTCSSLQFGYAIGVLNSARTAITECSTEGRGGWFSPCIPMSGLEWTVAVSMFPVGGLAGGLAGGPLCDVVGRRAVLLLNNVLLLGAYLCMGLTSNWYVFALVGRTLVGVGAGTATVVVPMYLAEVAPAKWRGLLGVLPQLATTTGIFLSQLLAIFLAPVENYGWRMLLLWTALIPVVQSAVLPWTPESPVYLIARAAKMRGGRHVQNGAEVEEVAVAAKETNTEKAARRALQTLRGSEDVQQELDLLRRAVLQKQKIPLEKRYASTGAIVSGDGDRHDYHGENDDDSRGADTVKYGDDNGNVMQSTGSGSETRALLGEHSEGAAVTVSSESWRATAARFLKMFRPPLLRFLLIGIFLQLAQQFSGINVVFFYSTSFFEDAGVSNADVATCVVGVTNVIFTVVSSLIIDRAGRKPLLIVSLAGMFLCFLVLSASFIVTFYVESFVFVGGIISVCAVIGFVISFAVGLGAIPWMILAELFPSEVRGNAMSIAVGTNWIATFIVGMTFVPINDLLQQFTFLPYTVVILVSLILVILFVPETKGKNIE